MRSKVSTLNNIQYKISNLDSDKLLELYKNMLKSRLIEEKMLILLRQGKNFEMVFLELAKRLFLLG